jgi:hypothetical protein
MDGLQVQWLLDEGIDMNVGFGLFLEMLQGFLATGSPRAVKEPAAE